MKSIDVHELKAWREEGKAHQLIDLRNESATVIRAARKQLVNVGERLPADQGEAIRQAADRLEELCATDEPPPIKEALDALNDAAAPLAELVLDLAVNQALAGKRLDEIEVQ